MKISILLSLNTGPFGGGNQFLIALKKTFSKMGVYEENPEKADVILFNSFPFNDEQRFKQAYRLKKKNKLLIHRIDGPIYKIRNKDLDIDKIIYKFNNILADGTIFQSEWSKSENYNLTLRKNRYEIVILNGSDLDIFNAKNKIEFRRDRKIRIVTTSWSSNWRKGFKIYQYLDEKLDFSKYEMTFIGNSPIKFRNINHISPLNSEELANQLRQHDIFITASQCDPCSNSLIEALNCGLTAIVLNNGGHPEIIGDGGLIFNDKLDIISQIDEMVKNFESHQEKIKKLDIKEVGAKYYDFISDIFLDFTNNKYHIKKINYVKFLYFYFTIIKHRIKERGLFRYFLNSIRKIPQSILLRNH